MVTLPRGAEAGKGTGAPFLLTVYPRHVGALSRTRRPLTQSCEERERASSGSAVPSKAQPVFLAPGLCFGGNVSVLVN